MSPLESAVLPAGIRSRFLDGINGLRVHVLEAGFETGGRPCVLLLHGSPEVAKSAIRAGELASLMEVSLN